jgi:tetratricopeptide (TPR) repeat protein
LNYFENLVNAGLLAEAQALLPRIRKLEINPATTAYAEGSVAMLQGKTWKAIALLRKAIAEDPNEGVYYYRLAFTYAQSGDLPQARESLKSALACRLMDSEAAEINKLIANTNDMLVWVNMKRGFTMLDQTNVEDAIKSFEKVTMIEPNNLNAFRELGYLYFNRLDFPKALNAFNHVSKLDPTDPYARFHILLLRSRLGETAEAAQELRMFLIQQAPRPTNDWPSHIGRFLAGQENEKQLFGSVEGMNALLHNGYDCEAHFYIGEKKLLAGDQASAEKEFKACIATGANDQNEFAGAKAELQALMCLTNGLPAPASR